MTRKKLILSLLVRSKGEAITVNTIANELNTSSKTIRNELNGLTKIVKLYDVNLIKKPGKGISIEGSHENIQRLLSHIEKSEDLSGDSPLERQRKILLRLFAANTPIMIKELRLDFYVGRTTITKDIKDLNHWLESYNLKIVYEKSEGLIIKGKEKDKRSALSKLLPSEYFYGLIENISEDQDKKETKIFMENFKQILELDIEPLKNIINEAEEELGYKFTTEAFINLLIHMSIAIKRSEEGNEIDLTEELVRRLNDKSEYKIAENTAKRIEKVFKVSLSNSEVYYILLHFLGSKTIEKEDLDFNFKLSLKDSFLEDIISKFIKEVEVSLNMYLESDIQLFNNLLLHIRPTINRMLYGLSLNNPLTKEIKENYLEIFLTISKHVFIINNAFNIELPEDEIGYLTLHFAAAVERNSKSIRVLIACASGIGMSQLISARIQRLFKNIKIVGIISILDINSYNHKDIDLVISTVNIPAIPNIRTVIVNPLLNEYDIANIRSYIDFRDKNIKKISLFQEKNIYMDIECKGKEEILLFINEKLLRNEYISPNYLKSLVDREKLGSTYIGNGVAVVHGAKSEVLESCIQIITLKEPIDWDRDSKVDFIINVVARDDDSKKFTDLFKIIGTRLDDKKFWNMLKRAKDKQELIEMLNKEFYYDN